MIPFYVLIFLATSSTVLAQGVTPEQDTLETSKRLKPITDDQWQNIAGTRLSENYDITQKDTLWDVSKRLFGDGYYWPKVWALNNGRITNPHVIFPGKNITFQPGSGSSLPSIGFEGDTQNTTQIAQAPTSVSTPVTLAANTIDAIPSRAGRSQEWRKLPRQPWEQVNLQLPPEVDPQGFDRRNKFIFSEPQGFELDAFITSEGLDELGTIKNADSPAQRMFMNDEIYINKDEDGIKVDQTYTITQSATAITSGGRSAYSYLNLGTVKITSEKDGLFVGRITSSRGPIHRGDLIVPLQDRVMEQDPRPGVEGVEGEILVDFSYSTSTTAQHKHVYINRGSKDGVENGMIFRAYQQLDPSNGQQIGADDVIGEADFVVVQTTEEFCVALVYSSKNPISTPARVVLLTDVSDLNRGNTQDSGSGDAPTNSEGDDELDSLDPGGELSEEEKKELEQLEEYKDDEGAPVEDDEFDDEEDGDGTGVPPTANPDGMEAPTDDSLKLEEPGELDSSEFEEEGESSREEEESDEASSEDSPDEEEGDFFNDEGNPSSEDAPEEE